MTDSIVPVSAFFDSWGGLWLAYCVDDIAKIERAGREVVAFGPTGVSVRGENGDLGLAWHEETAWRAAHRAGRTAEGTDGRAYLVDALGAPTAEDNE